MGPNKAVHLMFLAGGVLLYFLMSWSADWIWGYFVKHPPELIISAGSAALAITVGVICYRNERLYTLAAQSASRRSAQTVMFHIVDGLARLVAPILPVTAEQLWKALPGKRTVSVHLEEFPSRDLLTSFVDDALVADWQKLLSLRDAVNAELETKRKDKVFGTSLGGSVQVIASGDDLALLRKYEDSLPMLFIVSAVAVSEGAAGSPTAIAVSKADGVKCQRCWRIVPSVAGGGDREGLCSRCVGALAEPVSP